MLDIHRARSRQIKLNLSPIDIRRDLLDPVAAILFMRGAKVEIRIECPPDLAANGDRMRLKQIVLNLSANAVKVSKSPYVGAPLSQLSEKPNMLHLELKSSWTRATFVSKQQSSTTRWNSMWKILDPEFQWRRETGCLQSSKSP